MAETRKYSININTVLLEYHYIANPTKTQRESASTVYTFVPIVEDITSSSPEIIYIDRTHYRYIGTETPADSTNLNTTQYETLNGVSGPIAVYVDASGTKYLKVGSEGLVDVKVVNGSTVSYYDGYKYYEKVSEASYYELCGKTPSSMKRGEIAVCRAEGDECIYVKNSMGQMVGFRSYEAQVAYVDENISEVYDLIYSIHYVPSWSVNPSVIFKKTSTPCTATARLSFNGTYQNDFNATTPSGWNTGATSGTTRTFTLSVEASSMGVISTTISKDSYSKSMSANITPVSHIFYGQNSSSNYKSLSDLSSFGTATTTSVGRAYTVAMTSGNYFYVAVPQGVTTPAQVGVGGASGFFENLNSVGSAVLEDPLTGDEDTYYFFRTQSTQSSGTFNYYLK